jgi:hypothetical protein
VHLDALDVGRVERVDGVHVFAGLAERDELFADFHRVVHVRTSGWVSPPSYASRDTIARTSRKI